MHSWLLYLIKISLQYILYVNAIRNFNQFNASAAAECNRIFTHQAIAHFHEYMQIRTRKLMLLPAPNPITCIYNLHIYIPNPTP